MVKLLVFENSLDISVVCERKAYRSALVHKGALALQLRRRLRCNCPTVVCVCRTRCIQRRRKGGIVCVEVIQLRRNNAALLKCSWEVLAYSPSRKDLISS